MSDVHSTEYNFKPKDALLGAQMLFVAFGALVLVPLLTGLDANVALFTAGIGTLAFQVITKGKVPVFLASSFAFIAPIQLGVKEWGISGTMCGLAAAGVLYIVLSLIIRVRGTDVIKRVLPPVVTGPVIMVIGLILAPIAVNMATGAVGNVTAGTWTALSVAMFSLAVTITVSLLAKGWLKLLPILSGISAGYLLSLAMGLVDFSAVNDAPWLAIPSFTMPTWNLDAIFFIVPVAIAPAVEHFGDILAIGNISGKDYVKDPGIKNTMLGDGIATSLAAIFGGPPNTTYSEVSGAVALTRAFNPAIMTWAAIAAILLAFVGKLGGFLSTIPTPVMGGIMILLFGAITVIGINTMVRAGHDLMLPRNMAVVAIILIVGLGGMSIGGTTTFGGILAKPVEIKLAGIGLAGVVGVLLNLILPCKDCNDEPGELL